MKKYALLWTASTAAVFATNDPSALWRTVEIVAAVWCFGLAMFDAIDDAK